MKIRTANKSDALGIAKVHVDTRRDTYKGIVPEKQLYKKTYKDVEQKWVNRITDSKSTEFIFVAENYLGEIIGFASASIKSEDYKFDSVLSTLYIYKDYQSKGIGRSLVRKVFKKLKDNKVKSLIVWVFADNSAIGFYKKLGGKLVKQKVVSQGEEILQVAYGWSDITKYI